MCGDCLTALALREGARIIDSEARVAALERRLQTLERRFRDVEGVALREVLGGDGTGSE